MVSIHSKRRYLVMFLGVQLVVMALLSREGYQKRVSYFIRIFRKTEGRNHTAAGISGADIYANLSHLVKPQSHGDDMPYCPKKSPLLSKCNGLCDSSRVSDRFLIFKCRVSLKNLIPLLEL